MSAYKEGRRAAIQELMPEVNAAVDNLLQQIEELTRDRDEWKQQHENLLAVRQQDIAALTLATPADAGAGQKMTKAQIDEIVYECRQSGKDATYDIVNAALARLSIPAAPVTAEPVARQLISDIVKLWDSPSIDEDEHHEELARIEGEMRKFLAAPVSPAQVPSIDRDLLETAAKIADRAGHHWSGAPALAFFEIAEKIRALKGQCAAAHVAKSDEWISVDERLPEGECLAVYVTPNGKSRLIRAKYTRQFQHEAEGDDCATEYNEEDDTFYIKAGWLECIDNWGEYFSCYVVEGTVTHWMPLPAVPIAAAHAAHDQKGGEK